MMKVKEHYRSKPNAFSGKKEVHVNSYSKRPAFSRYATSEPGRYKKPSLNYKFWTAIQSSGDIKKYGDEYDPYHEHFIINNKDLPIIKQQVKKDKEKFKKKHKVSYETFMKNTPEWMTGEHRKKNKKALEDASRIDLGEHVITALQKEKQDLRVVAEYG